MSDRSSSSNRVGGVCDAVLVQADRPVGPLRLPDHRADDFIADFNRTYRGIGMRLATVDPSEHKKIPGDTDATGDNRLS